MMKVITFNLNGIRSAARKGFFAWLSKQQADVVCLQEVRAQETDLQDDLFRPQGFHTYFHCGDKKGYSGVAIYTRHEPEKVVKRLGFSLADAEARYIAVKIGKVWIASIYLPSGTSGDERQEVKDQFLAQYETCLRARAHDQQIICGDFNIAHKEIDLKNWRANQKNSGFLPKERAWLDKLFGELKFVDAFRKINQEKDQYTWWSNRGQAYAKNVGWRIDYQVVTDRLSPTIISAQIYKDERFSDHAPLLMEYDIIP